jgi:hypothetical protein
MYFSQVGSVPRVKSIRGVALNDPKDGIIHHMHHVMTMEGCEPRDSTLIEKDAITFAIKLGHRTEHLKVLHTPDSINPFAKYCVDTIKLGLIELPKPTEIRDQ